LEGERGEAREKGEMVMELIPSLFLIKMIGDTLRS